MFENFKDDSKKTGKKDEDKTAETDDTDLSFFNHGNSKDKDNKKKSSSYSNVSTEPSN